jgi:site-specific recombinase XerD
MDDYAEYEEACEQIREENEALLDEFAAWLEQKRLSEATIRRHRENVDFYINEYLLYEDAIEAKDGASDISMFLGYWFIKKAMWASPAQIKSNAASLKKFYAFMQEKGEISPEELSQLNETVKEEMPEWLETMQRYDDPDIDDMAEVWGLDF